MWYLKEAMIIIIKIIMMIMIIIINTCIAPMLQKLENSIKTKSIFKQN